MVKKRERETDDDAEQAFLEGYRPGAFPRPSVTVDLVIFTVRDRVLSTLLVRRGEHPFKGRWALPGGFVRVSDDRLDQGESLDDAAHRELAEETGLDAERAGKVRLEQVGAFGAPGRDPRMRVISVAYCALLRPTLAPLVRAGGDVDAARWYPLDELPPLAFDHATILDRALAHVRARLESSPIAFELVPETFTIAELRTVHELVYGQSLDPGNFRKRFLRMVEEGVLEKARGSRATASKPASVYRFVRT